MLFNGANILKTADIGNELMSWSRKANWILFGDIFKLIGIDPNKVRRNISLEVCKGKGIRISTSTVQM
jgi:hypothetical protein